MKGCCRTYYGCLLAFFFVGLFARTALAEQPVEKWRVPLSVEVTDPDGDVLTFEWVQIAGPKVRIADPKKKNTYFVPTEAGTYQFEIRVSDGQAVVTAPVKKVVRRTNVRPVAKITGMDKGILKQRISLQATNSFDPDGVIKAYEWKQISGRKVKIPKKMLSERQIYFEIDEPGDYGFQLRVSDGKLWSIPVSTLVRIAPINRKPVVVPGPDQEFVIPVRVPRVGKSLPRAGTKPIVVVKKGRVIQVGEQIVLDGSASKDPLGEPVEFFWNHEVDVNSPMDRTLIHDLKSAVGGGKTPFDCPVWRARPTKPGIYKYVLEVSAGKGAKRRSAKSKPVIFEVRSSNRIPTANIFVKQPRVEKGDIIRLDGSASSDLDKDKLEYLWSWSGKGKRPKSISFVGPKAQFVAEMEGEYGIQLIVSDRKSKSKPVQTTVVAGPANRPPTIKVPESVTASLGQTVKVEAIVYDPDNDRTEVQWTIVGPKGFKLPKDVLSKTPLVFVPKKEGVYVFDVFARDARGASKNARVQVAVAGGKDTPPTAIITGPASSRLGGEVTLSGAKSHDREGKRLTYVWKQLSGPDVPGDLPSNAKKEWVFTPKVVGVYEFSLAVSDGASVSAAYIYKLKVIRQNLPPVAKVVPPPAVFVGQQVVIDGSGSADADKDKLTFAWKILGDKGAVLVEGAGSPKLKIIAKRSATLEVELVVSDGTASSQPARVKLLIKQKNRGPIARITGQDRVELGQAVELTANKSSDPDGKIKGYRWQQIKNDAPDLRLSARSLNRSSLRLRPEKPGVYLFQLIVIDSNDQASEPAKWTLTIVGKRPIAVIKIESNVPAVAGTVVQLSGRLSKGASGGRLIYSWRQKEGPRLSLGEKPGDTLKLTPVAAGSYVIELVVNNGDRDSAPVQSRFLVSAANRAPVARISEVAPCEPGGKITLDASASVDPDGRSLEFRWTSVSKPEKAKVKFPWRGYKRKTVQVALPVEGSYVFELKVYDGKLWSPPVSVTVATKVPNKAPRASAVAWLGGVKTGKGATALVSEQRREIILDGSGSVDPDKGPNPLSFTWKQLSGVRAESVKEEGVRLRMVPGKIGRMTWQLTVSDGKLTSAPVQVSILILTTGSLPVAAPERPLITINVATRGLRNDPNVVILDATRSYVKAGKRLRYIWKQTGGEDLELRPESLAKSRVGLKIYHSGKYSFSLTVFDGEYYSLPQTVNVVVREPSMGGQPLKTRARKKGPIPSLPETDPKDGALLPPPKDATIRDEPAPTKVARKEAVKEIAQPKPTVNPVPVSSERPREVNVAAVHNERPNVPVVVQASTENQDLEHTGTLLPPPQPLRTKAVEKTKTFAREEPRVVTANVQPVPMQKKEEVFDSTIQVKADGGSIVVKGKVADKDSDLFSRAYRSEDPLFQRNRDRIKDWTNQPGRKAEEQLIRRLNNRDKDLARLAAAGLVKRGLGSVPALIQELDSKSPLAKKNAHWALAKISNKTMDADSSVWKKWWNAQLGL